MPRGARFHKSANLILRRWLTYSQLFVILHSRSLQLDQGVPAFLVNTNVFISNALLFMKYKLYIWNCSIISRYGIHGFPTLFLLNSTMRVRYHGPRTVKPLAAFYSDVSGMKIVACQLLFFRNSLFHILFWDRW
jgi:hypothetical protein